MEHVDAILWHKVGLADFKGIHSINRNGKGSSQTYFQAAGYDKNDLSTMLKYATNKIDTGKKWDTGDPKIKYVIDAIALGTTKSKAIEFDPRGGSKTTRKEYKISKQTLKDRHPAWHPNAGFPELPKQVDSGGKVKYVFDEAIHSSLFENLRIFLIRTYAETGEHKYYATFVDSASIPGTWPTGIGLECIFNGTNKQKKAGILFFDDCYIRFNNNKDAPFSVGSAADKDIGNVELPVEIDKTPEDAVEYATKEIKQFDVVDISAVTLTPVSVSVASKKARNFSAKDMQTSPVKKGKKFDYVVRQKNLKKIGDLGERLAIEAEKRRLNKEGRPDLSALVEHVSETQGDGLGYDIKSFEHCEDGTYRPKYIEVKATTGGKNKPFDITENEVEVSAELGEQYSIYRFFGLHNQATAVKYYEIRGSVADHFELKPTAYKAYLK